MSVRDVDLLSVVALGLAVIAFLAQLVVYVVQSQDAATQREQAHDIHASTIRLLTTIEDQTRATQDVLVTVNTRLIEHLLGKASAAQRLQSIDKIDDDALVPLPGAMVTHDETPALIYPRPLAPSDAAAIRTALVEFPEPTEFRNSLPVLQRLRPSLRRLLVTLGQDARESTADGALFGPGVAAEHGPLRDQAVSEGIARAVQETDNGLEYLTLTALGLQLARVLVADPPPWATEQVVALRTEGTLSSR